MSDQVVKDLEFRIRANTAELDKLKTKLQGVGTQSKATSQQMGGLVNQDLGRRMSQFNEKTEKGRQLTLAMSSALGSQAGGLAGSIVYYTGTMAYSIGRMSLFEMGIMGVLAAIGVLAYKLASETPGEKRWREYLETVNGELEQMETKLRDIRYEREKTFFGISKEDELVGEAGWGLAKAYATMARRRDEYNKASSRAHHRMTDEVVALRDRYNDAADAVEKWKEKVAEAQAGQEEARQYKLAEESKSVISGGAGNKKDKGGKAQTRYGSLDDSPFRKLGGRLADWYSEQMQEVDRKAAEWGERIRSAERKAMQEHYAEVLSFHEALVDRQTALTQRRIEREQEMEDRAYANVISLEKKRWEKNRQYAQMGADAVMSITQAIYDSQGKGIWRSVSDTLKAMAFEASGKALYQLAEAIAAFASKRYDEGFEHLAAMGQYTAFAAAYGGGAAATGAMAGRGGGGGPSRSERSWMQSGGQREQDRSGDKVEVHIHGNQYNGRGAAREMKREFDEFDYRKNPGAYRRKVG